MCLPGRTGLCLSFDGKRMVSHDRTKLKLSHSAWNDNSPDIYLVSLVQSLTEQPSPAWDSSPSSPSLQSAAGLPSLAHCPSSSIHFNVNTFLMLLFSSRPSNIFIPFSTCVLLNSQEISNFIPCKNLFYNDPHVLKSHVF